MTDKTKKWIAATFRGFDSHKNSGFVCIRHQDIQEIRIVLDPFDGRDRGVDCYQVDLVVPTGTYRYRKDVTLAEGIVLAEKLTASDIANMRPSCEDASV